MRHTNRRRFGDRRWRRSTGDWRRRVGRRRRHIGAHRSIFRLKLFFFIFYFANSIRPTIASMLVAKLGPSPIGKTNANQINDNIYEQMDINSSNDLVNEFELRATHWRDPKTKMNQISMEETWNVIQVRTRKKVHR